jgi:hypothetical protein
VAAPAKLTEADVKRIRQRVRTGEHQTALADEFGVSRKTIRRRLDALELAETEQAERIAKRRLRRQAAREKRKLLDSEQSSSLPSPIEHRTLSTRPGRRARVPDPYFEWLDRRKNLSGRALADARGLVRVRNFDDTRRVWVERADVDALLDDGWLLDD